MIRCRKKNPRHQHFNLQIKKTPKNTNNECTTLAGYLSFNDTPLLLKALNIFSCFKSYTIHQYTCICNTFKSKCTCFNVLIKTFTNKNIHTPTHLFEYFQFYLLFFYFFFGLIFFLILFIYLFKGYLFLLFLYLIK